MTCAWHSFNFVFCKLVLHDDCAKHSVLFCQHIALFTCFLCYRYFFSISRWFLPMHIFGVTQFLPWWLMTVPQRLCKRQCFVLPTFCTLYMFSLQSFFFYEYLSRWFLPKCTFWRNTIFTLLICMEKKLLLSVLKTPCLQFLVWS